MSAKSYLVRWLRKAHLFALVDHLRYWFQRIKNRSRNNTFRAAHPTLTLPPDFFIYETYRADLQAYYEDGLKTAGEIVDEFKKGIDVAKPGVRILDWGCGPARITRHLPALLPAAEIYGTDYNRKYIDWCSSALPSIQFSLNRIDPPLAYNESFFDAIISISIFTHLSAASHNAWANELYRVLKPGGVAFITTQGAAYRPVLIEAERFLFDKNELVVREDTREGNRLFSAFQPPLFMQQLFAGKFEVIDFVAAPTIGAAPAQDQWLVRKLA
jgi:ubiquinone/menaquinone biosynthesis C-methylase UbiE